jgi:hypothetical protein
MLAMTAYKKMAPAAVTGGLGLQPAPRTSGATCDSRIHSRARAARVFAFAVYAGFGIPTATFIIILAHLIDWSGVAESIGLY